MHWSRKVAAAGRMSAEQRRELEDIMNDISSWQRRSVLTDLVASRSRPIKSPATAALVGKTPGSSPSCLPCPPVSVSNGQICFLTLDGDCPPTTAPGDIALRVCVYACIYTAPSPIKSR